LMEVIHGNRLLDKVRWYYCSIIHWSYDLYQNPSWFSV
jgi:hypothetical protein